MNSIGFDLENARSQNSCSFSFPFHLINIENSCDFKQHAINESNRIMGSKKRMKPFANGMKSEAKKE